MTEKVISIHGGPTGCPEPNDACIKALEEWLELARAGEIIGVATAGLCHDGLGRWAVAGKVGGCAMVGALEAAKADVLDVVRDD